MGKRYCQKRTTQGDPTSMGIYALWVTPLLYFFYEFMLTNKYRSKDVAFADDLRVSENIKEIKQYWELLFQVGPKYGNYPNLIVKEEHLDRAKLILKGSEVKIMKSGQRHSGAAIGSNEFKRE